MQHSELEDLVAANRILAEHGVIDAYGHVSLRSPDNPQRFFLARAIAPETVQIEDILEYDLDARPVEAKGDSVSERFIHSEIYRARPDVMAVVHSHSPSVIPFGVTRTKLRPVYHMGSFLWSGAPVFEIRNEKKDNDLLIRDNPLGRALAGTLGKCNCVLMRGHGMTVIGDSVPEAVFRAIYTEMNARLQLQATQLEGPIEFLSEEEGRRSSASNRGTIERPWELWKRSVSARGRP